GLTDVGPYKAFNWQIPDYKLPEYEKTNFNFADKYEAPDAYQAFNFTAPQIANVASVEPEAAEIWNAKRAEANEGVMQQFDDTRRRGRDAIVSGQPRPEQSAALMASIGCEEDKARRAAARDLAIAQSGQLVGIRQQEQNLAQQKNIQQASFEQQQQEA